MELALAAIAPASSLSVLGEPGIGKSRGLRELTVDDDEVIHIGLETVADVQDLRDRLPAVESAVTEGRAADRLTLVLDSMDECPIPAKSLLHHLESTLQRHRVLRVVLGCRTADWPEDLGARLRSLVPCFEVVELLPLGRSDIAVLAATRGIDGDTFLAAVVDAGAVPLAALPLTLDLLLILYQQAGHLPGSAVELYEQGLLRLVRMDLDGPLATRWERGHLSLGELWQLYTSYPYLPRMRDRGVLVRTVEAALEDTLGWETNGFALARSYDPDPDAYGGLCLPGYDEYRGEIDQNTLLVRPDRTVSQRQAELARGAGSDAGPGPISGLRPLVPGQGSPLPNGRHPGTSRAQSDAMTASHGVSVMTTRHRFFGSRTLDPTRYGADFAKISEEILQHLAARPDARLTVRVEIEALSSQGFSPDLIRTVEENATTLRFDQRGFEQERPHGSGRGRYRDLPSQGWPGSGACSWSGSGVIR
jgi:hypothetical protein